ncbi:MAG: hypothetical protein CR965_00220 [Paludibacter sp.]|nr:MAG: hypothetical protein CR965_00220 [Paludibacter sp.]
MIERKIKYLIREINLVYYAVYLITVLIAVGIFLMNIGKMEFSQVNETSQLGRNISTVYLVYLLGAIPFSLYGFTKRAKKWQEIENESLMFEKYKQGSRLRIVIVGLALIVGVVLVYVLNSKSMIFSAGIAAVALYFCKPTYRKITKDLNLK